ncbi:unnamed protein product [Rhizophagus irregularis]|nr:unnamed protein product [Rhizophagus irregularis]
MPTCTYCNKVFKDWQALGNHIRTHLDDSDKDIPLTNQSFHDTSIQIHNPNIFTKETNVTIHVEQNIHQQVLKVLFYIIIVLINIKELFNTIYPIV